MQFFRRSRRFLFINHQSVPGRISKNSFKFKAHFTEEVFPERSVQIQTCGNLYQKWREENRYSRLPKGDLTFNIKFMDTRPNDSSNSSPTVLALHGVPGSWKEYVPLASFLHKRGCRVIAPSFPDFHTCKPGVFRHTAEEKAQFVKDFLSAISVKHVDVLACHSAGVYPALQLCLDDTLSIKLLILLNPGTFNMERMSSTRYSTLMNFWVKASENPIALSFIKRYGPFILKHILKVKVRFESALDPLLSATAMIRANIPESKEKFQLVSQRVAVMFIFSEGDPLVSTKPSYELAELLGAKTSDIFVYDKDGCLERKGTVLPKLKVIAMKQGSHYAFLKHPEVVNNEISDFMKCQNII